MLKIALLRFLDVTLIGKGVEYLPHFIRVLEEMGASGKYGGLFRLRWVESPIDHSVVYDGPSRQILRPPAEWQGREDSEVEPAHRMRIQFVTPLRMRTDGRYNASPTFQEIAQALLRRASLLTAIYGDAAPPEDNWVHRLMTQADRVQTLAAEFQPYRWARTSGRQGRRIAMDGMMGSVFERSNMPEGIR